MADENTIGVKATLDTTDFEAGTKRLDAKIAAIEKGLDDFERKQADNARKTADAANKAADAQDKANKKISDSADRTPRNKVRLWIERLANSGARPISFPA